MSTGKSKKTNKTIQLTTPGGARNGKPKTISGQIDQAEKFYFDKKYEEAIELLTSILERIGENAPPTEQKVAALYYLSYSLYALERCIEAKPYMISYIEDKRKLKGIGTEDEFRILSVLYCIYRNSKDYLKAYDICKEEARCFGNLSKDNRRIYANTVVEIADFDLKREAYIECLSLYEEAKKIFVENKYEDSHRKLIVKLIHYHQKLYQFDKAFTCCKQLIKLTPQKTNEYGDVLIHLSSLYYNLKQYEKACVLMEEALTIKNVDKQTVETKLTEIREKARIVHRESLEVGHMYRICNECDTITENMDICNGCCRAWYCNKECQLRHWPTHKPLCVVCMNCDKPLNRDTILLRCSLCNSAKYCDEECLKANLEEHKKTCNPTKE